MFSSFAQALISDTKAILPGSSERAIRRNIRDAMRSDGVRSEPSRSRDTASKPNLSVKSMTGNHQSGCTALYRHEHGSTMSKIPQLQAAALREVIADLVAENQRLQRKLDTKSHAERKTA